METQPHRPVELELSSELQQALDFYRQTRADDDSEPSEQQLAELNQLVREEFDEINYDLFGQELQLEFNRRRFSVKVNDIQIVHGETIIFANPVEDSPIIYRASPERFTPVTDE